VKDLKENVGRRVRLFGWVHELRAQGTCAMDLCFDDDRVSVRREKKKRMNKIMRRSDRHDTCVNVVRVMLFYLVRWYYFHGHS
jgi:aspartyl-tRNA synthetase